MRMCGRQMGEEQAKGRTKKGEEQRKGRAKEGKSKGREEYLKGS